MGAAQRPAPARPSPATDPPLPRELFGVTEDWIYLDHAGVNPTPIPVARALTATVADVAAGGSLAIPATADHQEEVRDHAAWLMGVTGGSVAFTQNTTQGLSFVANGLDWESGDRVVVPDREFQSTIFPWLALRDRGVRVDRVDPRGASWELPVDAFVEVIRAGPPPKVVCTSWVQYGRGWRTDLAALADACHDVGALFVVDAIQGLGAIPAEFDAWGVDVAAAGAHKWMLGPPGVGVVSIHPDVRDRIRPSQPGWASVAHRTQWEDLCLIWDDSARRYEGGTTAPHDIAALGTAIDLILDAGVHRVWRHIRALTDHAAERLRDVGATVLSDRREPHASGVLVFQVEDIEHATLANQLRDAGFVCSPRGGGVRIAPHAYNTHDEIDAFVAAVGELRG